MGRGDEHELICVAEKPLVLFLRQCLRSPRVAEQDLELISPFSTSRMLQLQACTTMLALSGPVYELHPQGIISYCHSHSLSFHAGPQCSDGSH